MLSDPLCLMLLVTVTQVLVVEDSDVEQDDNSEDAAHSQREAPPSSATKGAQSQQKAPSHAAAKGAQLQQQAPCLAAAKGAGPGTGASGRSPLTSPAAQAEAATGPLRLEEGDKENVAPGDKARHSGEWQGILVGGRTFWWVAGQLQHILVGTQDILAGHWQGLRSGWQGLRGAFWWVAGHSQDILMGGRVT